MSSAFISLFRREIWPRRRGLVLDSGLLMALVATACFAWKGSINWPSQQVDAALQFLSGYAGTVFGFSMATLTLVITLPQKSLVDALVLRKGARGMTAYSNLAFVFFWTSLSHLILLGSCLLLQLTSSTQFTIGSALLDHSVATLALALLAFYSIFQCLDAVVTLADLGTVIIATLQKEAVAESQRAMFTKPKPLNVQKSEKARSENEPSVEK